MFIYWGACYISMFLALIKQKLNIKQGNAFAIKVYGMVSIFIVGFPLFIISALRYNVGTDYQGYLRSFNQIKYGYNPGMEPLFVFINKLVIFLDGDFQWVMAICSALFIYFVLSEIFRKSQNAIISIFLLMGSLQYFYSLTNVRQMVGIAILLYSIRYVEKKDTVRFFITVIIASCIHKACILFVFVYWVDKIKISNKKGLILTAVIFFLRFPISEIIRLAVSYTGYAVYLGSKWDVDEISYSTIFVQGAVLVLAAYYRNKDDTTYNRYLNIQYLSFWISLYSGLLPQVYRIQRIFGMPSIILIPLLLSNIRSKFTRNIIILFMIVLYTVYTYYSAVLHDQYKIIPYMSVFDVY